MATIRKYLDENGLLYYNQKIQAQLLTKIEDVEVNGTSVVTDNIAEIDLETPLAGKQDILTSSQMQVVNGVPFTSAEKNKLETVEENAEANTIISVSVNGDEVEPDAGRNVDIEVPTHITDLDASGFSYVEKIASGSANVTIGGTDKNPTIVVSALEMPEEFTSEETPSGSIGTLLTEMDSSVLVPIIQGSTLSLGDIVIFANNTQAIVTLIDAGNSEYEAVISRVPTTVTFASISGNPMNNTALASALNSKLDVNLGAANVGKYLYLDASGDVTLGEITPITNSEIDTIMGITA